MTTKQQLRKQYLAKRVSLSPDEYAALSQQLLHQFKSIPLDGFKYIHIYLPIVSRNEPDTLLLINWLKTTHPKIKIVYPKIDLATLSMANYVDDENLAVSKNLFGVTEPVNGNQIAVELIDAIIVPLLTFDKRGYRVGYGKGFYDRFMANCKPATRFIGLSFFEPIDGISDIDKYDIPLHQCITPNTLWTF